MRAVAVVVRAGVPGRMQFVPWRASRSGLARSMPVSSTATAAPAAAWTRRGRRGADAAHAGRDRSPDAAAAWPAAASVASGWTKSTAGWCLHARDLGRGEVGREALDRRRVAQAGEEAGRAAEVGGRGVGRRDGVAQHDDVRALGRLGGLGAGGREQRRGTGQGEQERASSPRPPRSGAPARRAPRRASRCSASAPRRSGRPAAAGTGRSPGRARSPCPPAGRGRPRSPRPPRRRAGRGCGRGRSWTARSPRRSGCRPCWRRRSGRS